jgi:hypothetical protein
MTTTPFDMVVRNDMDRFHLAMEVINRVPNLGYLAAYAKQAMRDKLIEHKEYIERHGDNPPESVIGMDRRVELQRKLGGRNRAPAEGRKSKTLHAANTRLCRVVKPVDGNYEDRDVVLRISGCSCAPMSNHSAQLLKRAF